MTKTINDLLSNPSLSLTDNMVTQKPTGGVQNYRNNLQQLVDLTKVELISNPSNNLYWAPNEFTQNGTATDGSPIITGLGSTSRMYVGMSVDIAVFPPSSTILSIDSETQITINGNSSYSGLVTLTCHTDREGSDTTGTGQITKPFATYEKARERAVELGAGQGNPFNLICLGNFAILGTFNLSPYVNIDFNGAYFSMDSIVTAGSWEGSDTKIVMQNGQLISTWNLDTSSLGTFQKEILWRNIWAQNGSIDIILKGNGSEYFCIANDTATDAYTFYVNKIESENFSIQSDSWLATNFDGIKVTNTLNSVGSLVYFTKDIFANVSIVTTGTQQNVLQTRGCTVGGTITIDGSNAQWIYDAISYKEPVLLNGATTTAQNVVEGLENPGHMIQINHASNITPLQTEWNRVYHARLSGLPTSPCEFIAPINATGKPGDCIWIVGLGSAGWNISRGDNITMIYNKNDVSSLRSRNQFDSIKLYCTDAGQTIVTSYTITSPLFSGTLSASVPINPSITFPYIDSSVLDPYGGYDGGAGSYTIPETGTYEMEYRVVTSSVINGDFNVSISLEINGSTYISSVVTEQQDFITVGGTLRKSLTGFVTLPLSGTDIVIPQIINNSSMIINVDSGWIDIKRIS